MRLSEQIKKSFDKLTEEIKVSARARLIHAMTELQPYITDHMHSGQNVNQTKRSDVASGKLYSAPNKTDKLYVLYGNLVRALIPNQRGNVSKVTKATLTEISVTFGIDLAQVPYARVHELQGVGKRKKKRPYFYPGIKDYLKENSQTLLADIVAHAHAGFK